ncbi:MAG: hypothetical protein N2112_05525 [Gemmataceae bacterium]|jgi:hypothetical protein|nr:hypothetical protein [Gemmataceae bacterium]
MTNQEWIELFKRVPPEDLTSLVVVLKSRAEITVDTIVKFEPNYAIIRGRLAGTTDEGRGFIIPYDQLEYFRIEQFTKTSQLEKYGGVGSGSSHGSNPEIALAPTTAQVPTDPATASRMLLDKIRASRSQTSRPG